MQLLNSSVEGDYERFKLRFRWYRSQLDMDGQVGYNEIKKKCGSEVTKRRVQRDYKDNKLLFNFKGFVLSGPEQIFFKRTLFSPKLHIRYKRKWIQSSDIRVTFDKEMQYNLPKNKHQHPLIPWISNVGRLRGVCHAALP